MISDETPLILHHYPLSPFSEKIRAMLGYLNMNWHSAITSEMPPRPLIDSLAGGYRKIPVAQIGADILCDSKTITSLLAEHTNKPELALEGCDQATRDFVSEVESDIFFACIFYASGMPLNRKVIKSLSIWKVIKLLFDRINMGRKANIKMVSPGQASGIVNDFLPKLDNHLSNGFIFGKSPTIADFAAYHSLWFVHYMGEKPVCSGFPRVSQWLEQMYEFGHGHPTEIISEQALEIAKYATPKPVAAQHKQHDLIGELVQIAPDDYALNPTTGVLEGCTKTSYIISRQDKQAGLVHVHFPQQGFALKKA